MYLRRLFYALFPFLEPRPAEPAWEAAAIPPPPLEIPTLTARELEVAWYIRAGLSNEQISNELGISISTVKSHVHHLLAKFRLRTRWELRDLLLEQWHEPF